MEGGHSIHADVEQTLIGLGFELKDMDRPVHEFSGGWRMRVELAKILLRRPHYILLDEPTNHLDIESIQWLESFLSSYNGGVLIISHDRVFLDSVSNRTIELSLGKTYDYRVSYSRYVVLKQERITVQNAAYENQQKLIQDTEQFINRFRYKATKAVQVQSRIKQLEKIDRIVVEKEDDMVMNLRFPPAKRSGTIVVEANGLSKSFGEHKVLDKVDLIIERGEKVAFVGRNGEGKTTLSRILVGVESVPDLWAIEAAGTYRGAFHVLHGLLKPLDGIGPDDLNLDLLRERVISGEVQEVILATRPSVEGEATALLVRQLLEGTGAAMSRIASGIPHGSELEYTDARTLERALTDRREMK